MSKKLKLLIALIFVSFCSSVFAYKECKCVKQNVRDIFAYKQCKCVKQDVCSILVEPYYWEVEVGSLPNPLKPILVLGLKGGKRIYTNIFYPGDYYKNFVISNAEYKFLTKEDEDFEKVKNAVFEYMDIEEKRNKCYIDISIDDENHYDDLLKRQIKCRKIIDKGLGINSIF